MTTALQDTVRDIQRKINVKKSRIQDLLNQGARLAHEIDSLNHTINRGTEERYRLAKEVVELEKLAKSINDFYGSPPVNREGRFGEDDPTKEPLARHGTIPVEGPAKYLFLRDREQSHSDPTKSYEVKVVGYQISPTLVRVAVFCNCPGFTFTRGKVSNGEKADCKHIANFKARVRWLEAATWEARQQGYTGDLVFRRAG